MDKILNLKAYNPDVELGVTGGLNRPPYKKDEGITALYEHARGLAAEIGFDLQDTATGGGSDGNFTAAVGVPTLDGLGADGHGAHTLGETIILVDRTNDETLGPFVRNVGIASGQ